MYSQLVVTDADYSPNKYADIILTWSYFIILSLYDLKTYIVHQIVQNNQPIAMIWTLQDYYSNINTEVHFHYIWRECKADTAPPWTSVNIRKYLNAECHDSESYIPIK